MNALIVNGERIDASRVDQERDQLLQDLSVNPSQLANDRLRLVLLDQAKQNVIDHYLLHQEASKKGLEIDEEKVEERVQWMVERNGGLESVTRQLEERGFSIESFKEQIRVRMRVDAIIDQLHESVSAPKDRHAKKHYKENKESFFKPDQVQLQQLVKRFRNSSDRFRVKKETTKIRQSAIDGDPFTQLVIQKSDQPENDGMLGWVSKDEFPETISEFVFSAEVGSFSELLEGDGFWYFLKVCDRREAHRAEFAEAKEEILEKLFQESKTQAVQELLTSLRKKAVISEE